MKKKIFIAAVAIVLTLICSFRIVASKSELHKADEDDIFGDWDSLDE